jgi:hypothetical protein
VPEAQWGLVAAAPGSPAAALGEAYFAVLALFCFGFLGVLAFLSTSTSGWLECLPLNPSAPRPSRE